MIVPLLFLAAGAVFAGMLLDPVFIGPNWQAFWNGSIFNAPSNHVIALLEDVPSWASLAPLGLAVLGVALVFLLYLALPLLTMQLASTFRGVYLFLLNKWYFDELYDAIFVQPAIRLSRGLWQTGDVTLIDGVPNGLAELTVDGSQQTVKIQTGSLAVYAFVM